MYLREMGAVPLLTRDGEVTLARKMERGKLRMQKSISRSPLVQQIVVEIAEQHQARNARNSTIWSTSAMPKSKKAARPITKRRDEASSYLQTFRPATRSSSS